MTPWSAPLPCTHPLLPLGETHAPSPSLTLLLLLLLQAVPLVTAVVSAAWKNEPLNRWGWLGVACSTAGVVVLVHPPFLFGNQQVLHSALEYTEQARTRTYTGTCMHTHTLLSCTHTQAHTGMHTHRHAHAHTQT